MVRYRGRGESDLLITRSRACDRHNCVTCACALGWSSRTAVVDVYVEVAADDDRSHRSWLLNSFTVHLFFYISSTSVFKRKWHYNTHCGES